MNLTAKIYCSEIFAGMVFYVVGVFLITPPTLPLFLKPLFCGIMVLTLAILFIKFFFNKSEKLDERAIHNLFKAGGITLEIFLLFLVISVVIFALGNFRIQLSSGILCLIIASLLCVHAYVFYALEKSGQ